VSLCLLALSVEAPVQAGDTAPRRRAYFGDLHVHTRYSFDAFLVGTLATPDDAYRYARGAAITHPSGYQVRLDRPLDFLAVTDHAMLLGVLSAMADPSQDVSKHPAAKGLVGARSLAELAAALRSIYPPEQRPLAREILDPKVVRSTWQDIVEAAERHNEPGRFTTFVGYEYTSEPDAQTLHRNVIFRDGKVPEVPFSRLDSANPEDLWVWMETLRQRGIEALAIPHNSNISNGLMFGLVDRSGKPFDADYAARRMRNEPLVEVTQVKGTSDTHPALSPNDEWAAFEIFPYRPLSWIKGEVSGSYVREAYLDGLAMLAQGGFNPYRFGLIGSSDTHDAASTPDESSFFGKVGVFDGTPEGRGSVPLKKPGPDGQPYLHTFRRLWSASGLAGVWAEENTRASIYDALRRKEAFATSGPRIRVRFFAGFDYTAKLLENAESLAGAYAGGVPMGGELRRSEARSPRFLVWALRDPEGTRLARLQVIKGWIAGGKRHEQVFDVACADDLSVDPATHRCPDNGAKVNLSDCSVSQGAGDNELKALWVDPEFDRAQPAFYYVRVLENPTCRWSTWDAIRAGVPPHPDLPKTIQERAWSSPIWYVP